MKANYCYIIYLQEWQRKQTVYRAQVDSIVTNWVPSISTSVWMTQALDNVLLGITVNQVGSGETIEVKIGMTSNTEYEHKEIVLWTTVFLHVFNVV